MRFIFLVSFFLLTQSISAQKNSTTALYTTAIDTVLTTIKTNKQDLPVLVRTNQFYKKNIQTYQGKYNLQLIPGFKENQKEWIGNKLTYLDLNPITVANGELIIIVNVGYIHYKSKRKWKLDKNAERFFYAIFHFDTVLNGFSLAEVVDGRFCPDTTH